jgi:hypothetical protein
LRARSNALAALAAAWVAAAAVAAPPAPEPTYDWCAPVVVVPDLVRSEVAGACVGRWTDEEIAAGARVALVGSSADVARANAASIAPAHCGIAETHRDRGRFVANLRALRARAGGAPLRVVHQHRFDIVPATLAAEPGFRADFLVATDRPWSEVTAFFARDRSPLCGADGCRFSFAHGGFEERGRGAWLRDWIDASGGPRRHESVVYYLARTRHVQRLFWATAALADQRNPAYRAWRVEQAKRALEIGGYDAIALNAKFHQYREPWWIASPRAPDVATVRERWEDGLWTAPPRGYGYAEYVEGWVALAADLRAAGVPYAITSLPAWPWPKVGADDPATRDRDEGRMIRDVVRGARIALLETRRDAAGLEAWAAELTRAGVEVVRVDTRCGYGRPARG